MLGGCSQMTEFSDQIYEQPPFEQLSNLTHIQLFSLLNITQDHIQ